MQADVFLLGVTGVHPEAGLTTADADEAAMKRLLSRRAADTYVLASEEKIGAASPFEVLPWAAVAGVITDADVGPARPGSPRELRLRPRSPRKSLNFVVQRYG